jgi:hypothetical protein
MSIFIEDLLYVIEPSFFILLALSIFRHLINLNLRTEYGYLVLENSLIIRLFQTFFVVAFMM